MKKLIPMMVAAACTFSVFAADVLTKTVSDFEGATPGPFNPTSDARWTKGEGDATVTAYLETDTPYDYGKQTVLSEGVGAQYLAIDNTAPIYRNAVDDKGNAAAALTDADLYIDTLVKFTVTDKDTAVETDENAKLALWLQATNEEGTENVLKLLCGEMVEGVLTPTTVELDKTNVPADAWHRLTVRAVKGTTTYLGVAVAEFEVFLDGEKVVKDEQSQFLACVAGTTVTGVGFKGNGAIDDVAFADKKNAPSFAVSAVTVVTCGTGIVSFEYAGKTYTAAASIELDAETVTAEEITNVVTINGVAATVSVGEGTVSITANAALEDGSLTIAEALANGATSLKLVANLTETLTEMAEIADDVTLDLAGNTLTIGTGDEVAFSVTGKLTILSSGAAGAIVSATEAPLFNPDGGSIVFGLAEGDAGVTVDGLAFGDTTDVTINNGAFDSENNDVDTIDGVVAEGLEAVLDEETGYIVVQEKGEPEPEPTALTSIELSATEVEYGTAVAPTATVKAGEDVVDAENYDISYSETLTATTPAGTVIDVTATAKGDDYTGEVKANFTVVAKAVEPTVTLSATTAEFSDTLALPTVTVEGYTLDTDYDVAWDKSLPTENPAEDVVLTVTVAMKGNYTGSNTATFTVTPKKGGALPGDDYMAEGEKKAYDEWAKATGVTAEDTELAADLAVAFRLNVTDTETPADAIAAADAKATDLVKKIDLAKLASGEDALAAVKAELPAGLQAVLKPVEEIDTTASLFRLVIEPVNAN